MHLQVSIHDMFSGLNPNDGISYFVLRLPLKITHMGTSSRPAVWHTDIQEYLTSSLLTDDAIRLPLKITHTGT